MAKKVKPSVVDGGEKDKKKKKKRGGKGGFLRGLKQLAVMLLVLFTFRSAIADWHDVPTGSMNPTIMEGDRIVVNKVAYDLKVPFTQVRLLSWGGPDRGDIVTFWGPRDEKRYVKRVVAVPGDMVEFRDGKLIVNGVRAKYSVEGSDMLGPRRVMEMLGDEERRVVQYHLGRGDKRDYVMETKRVPEGKYLVFGDNRDNSFDSRYFGFVDRSQIIGKAFAVGISVEQGKGFKPRWGRWGKGLD